MPTKAVKAILSEEKEKAQNQETSTIYDLVIELNSKVVQKGYELTPYQRVKLEAIKNIIDSMLNM